MSESPADVDDPFALQAFLSAADVDDPFALQAFLSAADMPRQRHPQPGQQPQHPDSRTKLYAPDLTVHREPRPNHKWDGSIPCVDGLPSAPRSPAPGPRHNDDHEPQVPLGTWPTAAPGHGGLKAADLTWNGRAYAGFSWDNADLEDGSYSPNRIKIWRSGIEPVPPSAVLEQDPQNHCWSDINTDDGSLLPPIQYPETMPRVVDSKSGLDWRRRTWSSTLLERRRAELEERKQGNTGSSLHHAAETPVKAPEWECPEPERDPLGRLIPKKKKVEFHNHLSPRVPCYLRPAEECDMNQVANIYNREVTEGIQARDSLTLSTSAFIDILQHARNMGMPFLVAVYGSSRQPVRVQQENDVFTSCIRNPASTVSPDPKLIGTILGFSYLSVWKPGLNADPNGSSRATVQVNLFVHPDYRRMRLGTSLLDKIMTTIAPSHLSTDAYDFIDPDPHPLYKPHRDHTKDLRRFHKVFASFNVLTKVAEPRDEQKQKEEEGYDDDLQWMEELLVGQFRFEKVCRLKMVHRSSKLRPGPVRWMDEVMYEYECLHGFDPLGEERY